MAKIDIIEFRDEHAFDLVLKPMAEALKKQNSTFNSILIRFPHGLENPCHVSRSLGYAHASLDGMMAPAQKHANRPPRGVPMTKPWRPCKSAGQTKK